MDAYTDKTVLLLVQIEVQNQMDKVQNSILIHNNAGPIKNMLLMHAQMQSRHMNDACLYKQNNFLFEGFCLKTN